MISALNIRLHVVQALGCLDVQLGRIVNARTHVERAGCASDLWQEHASGRVHVVTFLHHVWGRGRGGVSERGGGKVKVGLGGGVRRDDGLSQTPSTGLRHPSFNHCGFEGV